ARLQGRSGRRRRRARTAHCRGDTCGGGGGDTCGQQQASESSDDAWCFFEREDVVLFFEREDLGKPFPLGKFGDEIVCSPGQATAAERQGAQAAASPVGGMSVRGRRLERAWASS
ncbi:unnamed protein product, partial [Urochloa humidicola]